MFDKVGSSYFAARYVVVHVEVGVFFVVELGLVEVAADGVAHEEAEGQDQYAQHHIDRCLTCIAHHLLSIPPTLIINFTNLSGLTQPIPVRIFMSYEHHHHPNCPLGCP